MHDFVSLFRLAETESFWRDVNWPFLWAAFVLVVDNIIRIVALFVVPRNRRPTAGMAWLITIFWLPVPGLLLFLLIGGNKLPKKRTAKQEFATAVVGEIADREEAKLGTELAMLPDGISNAVQLGRSLGAQPMVRGNAATIYFDYEESFARIAAAIREAKRYVYVEFYILVHDDATHDVFEAMREVSARGVEVRVLLDHISAVRNPGARRTAKTLKEIGAKWAYMLPVRPWRGQWQRPDLRNHRKLVLVDGQVGFMGSQNLVDSSYNKPANIRRGLHWRDLMVRVEGPAALGLEAVGPRRTGEGQDRADVQRREAHRHPARRTALGLAGLCSSPFHVDEREPALETDTAGDGQAQQLALDRQGREAGAPPRVRGAGSRAATGSRAARSAGSQGHGGSGQSPGQGVFV